MIKWSELKINDMVSDKTCAIVPDHIGKITGIISDTELEVEFFSGRVAICNRSDIGPIDLGPFGLSDFVYPDPEYKKFWCFECKQKTKPSVFYYNVFGLTRGICTKCGSYGAADEFYKTVSVGKR